MNVLIVTHSRDNRAVEDIASAIGDHGGRAVRLNTDLYPLHVKVSAMQHGPHIHRELIDEHGRRHDLEAFGAVYYRRCATGATLPEELDATREACIKESTLALYGTIAATVGLQLDPLSAVRAADHKEVQLRRAVECGLDVPLTLVSNDPSAVRTFYDRCDRRMVAKVQSHFAVSRDAQEFVVFTNTFRDSDLASLGNLRYAPMIFQESVENAVEVRAVVVGGEVFAAAIDPNQRERTTVDWRRDGAAIVRDWEPYDLPTPVRRGLLELVARFGLRYGAADLIVTPEGRHVFLEVNACGEWYWLQLSPGFPIADAIARLLLGIVGRPDSLPR